MPNKKDDSKQFKLQDEGGNKVTSNNSSTSIVAKKPSLSQVKNDDERANKQESKSKHSKGKNDAKKIKKNSKIESQNNSVKKDYLQQEPKRKMTILDKLMILFLASGFIGVVSVIGTFFYISSFDINIDNLLSYKPEEATIVYDKDGEVIAEIAKDRRTFVPIKDVPEQLKQAFISAEDRTFYTNHGIDPIGLARAMGQNFAILLRGNKERYIGASTIAQQVVRNLVLNNERTAIRKIKEMAIAYKISSQLSKDRIFEIYLNHIYLGFRSYGIVSAAKAYFRKDLQELSLDECAILAALPKAPSILDPRRNPKRAVVRRNWVLNRMLVENFISKHNYNNAINKKITVYNRVDDTFGWAFIEYIKYTLDKNGLSSEDMGVGGYHIHTTMVKKWQKIAQEELDNGLIIFSKRQGYLGAIDAIIINSCWVDKLKTVATSATFGSLEKAVVLYSKIDNKEQNGRIIIGLQDGSQSLLSVDSIKWAKRRRTKPYELSFNNVPLDEVLRVGDVIAVRKKEKTKDNNDVKNIYTLEQIPLVNGGVVIMSPKTGEISAMVGCYADIPTSFNRGFQAARQAGSIVKPFVYLSALQNNVSPIETFMDAELSFNIGNGEVWKPKNVNNTYSGPVAMRTGLEESLNTVTIRVANYVGIGEVIRTFKKFDLLVNYPHNLSLALGSGETTLLDMVRSYATIANYGTAVNPISISKITLVDNKEISLDQITEEKKQSHTWKQDEKNSGWLDMGSFLKVGKNNTKTNTQLISPQISYQLISILKGAAKRGSIARRVQNLKGLVFGGKTGTSQCGRDLWFIGISPDIVIGVFVGYDIPTDAIYEYGSTAALPIYAKIMERLKPELSEADFTVPSGIKLIKIHRRTGELATNAPIGVDVIYEAFKDGDSLPSGKEEEKLLESNNLDDNFNVKIINEMSDVY
ncbi:MAG: transglycosylase domain-containing protein [Alphaproteobacteria bacterium]|nr:transglycosylase domain-containing protein [Rickettsiales bacterium]